MPFPEMKSGTGTVIGEYHLGQYSCLLIQNPESRSGPIKYMYMLVVTERNSKSPILVVTCERNEMQGELLGAISATLDEQTRKALASAPQTFLCMFDKDGTHHNLGDVPANINANEFREKAIAVARERLVVTSQPTTVNLSYPSTSSQASTRSTKSKWIIGLTIAALIVAVLFPPYTEHFFMRGTGEISGHGGWQLISNIGSANYRMQTESISVGLWLLELVVIAGTGGLLWYLTGKK